jgi:hypothetical protein
VLGFDNSSKKSENKKMKRLEKIWKIKSKGKDGEYENAKKEKLHSFEYLKKMSAQDVQEDFETCLHFFSPKSIKAYISFCEENDIRVNLSSSLVVEYCKEKIIRALSDGPDLWKKYHNKKDSAIAEMIPLHIEYKILSQEQILKFFEQEIGKYVFSGEVFTKKEVVKLQNIITLAEECNLKISHVLLEKYKEKQQEQKENPVKITGFDKIDLKEFGFRETEANAEDILRKAIEILPNDFGWENVEKIEYDDKVKVMPGMYGFKEKSDKRQPESSASFDMKNRFIIFHKVTLEDMDKDRKHRFVTGFAVRLFHELSHSMDPREVKQADLSDDDCKEMLLDWSRVRKEEEPFSTYVKKIRDQNDAGKDDLESQEDFAETVSVALYNPNFLKDISPKRAEFCEHWLKKRFPEYDTEKTVEKLEEYHLFLDDLE